MHRKIYRQIALGGTFDHFHAGHEFFIDFAANLAESLVVGVLADKLAKSKDFAKIIEPFNIRRRNVIKYCQKKKYPLQLVELNDIFGPTVSQNEIEAICVTEETLPGATKINQLREKMGLKTLQIHVCPYYKIDQYKINSTAIRQGLISRQGNRWIDIFKSDITLNDLQRKFCKEIQGNLVETPAFSDKKYIVGDTSLAEFINHKWSFDMAIFDGYEQRQPIEKKLITTEQIDLEIVNPAGVIRKQAVDKLSTAISSHFKYIFVDGEEDLLVIPLVLLLPFNTAVYYGQPNQGLVEIIVTEEIKQRFYHQFA